MVKHRKILLMALIFGVITALLINAYIEKRTRESAAGQVTARVVVAKTVIPAKTVITIDMLELKEIPREFLLQGVVQDPKEIAGSISRGEITIGEQVTKSKLVGTKNSVEGLALMIPTGKRAVSLAINDVSGISGLVTPGDRVDVLSTFELSTKDLTGQVVNATITNLVLQDIEVLAVGQRLTEKTETKDEKVVQEVQTVTVAVYLNQAQPLVMASEKGSLRLMLRSPVDKSTAPLKAFDLRQFLAQ